jgi:pyruvate,orthophosphate dikinase
MQLRDHVLCGDERVSMDFSRTSTASACPARVAAARSRRWASKAFNLARMAAIGLPVPQAFVLGTLCQAFGDDPAAFRPALRKLLESQIERLEAACGLEFGSGRKPCWCRYARARRCPCPA